MIIFLKTPLIEREERGIKGWKLEMRAAVNSILPLCTNGARVWIFNTLWILHFSQMQFFASPQNAMKCPAFVPLFMLLSLCGTPTISSGHHLSSPPAYRVPRLSFKYRLNFIFLKKFVLLRLFKKPYPQELKQRKLSKKELFTIILTRLGNICKSFFLMKYFTGIKLQGSRSKHFLVKW